MYDYRCEVVRVIDGDTVELNIDLGFDCWYKSITRLKGINAPEMSGVSRVDAVASKTALVNLLAQGPCTVITELRKDKDKYGRVLATLWVGGKNVNQQLIDLGFAVVYIA